MTDAGDQKHENGKENDEDIDKPIKVKTKEDLDQQEMNYEDDFKSEEETHGVSSISEDTMTEAGHQKHENGKEIDEDIDELIKEKTKEDLGQQETNYEEACKFEGEEDEGLDNSPEMRIEELNPQEKRYGEVCKKDHDHEMYRSEKRRKERDEHVRDRIRHFEQIQSSSECLAKCEQGNCNVCRNFSDIIANLKIIENSHQQKYHHQLYKSRRCHSKTEITRARLHNLKNELYKHVLNNKNTR